jgi:hypothetical protein
VALLLCALTSFAWRAAPALAHGRRGACSPHASPARHTRACAGSARAPRAHTKAKRHRRPASHSKAKRQAHHGASTHTAGPAPAPARCEDGSAPTRDGEGAYACVDGSEPTCANGSEPFVAHGDSQPLCAASSTAPALEWSEAGCDDGSGPLATGDGAYVCEDGSAPECEDGSRPTAADEGSMLMCPAPGPAAPPFPGPPSAAEEEGEGVEEAAAFSSVRDAIAS